MSGRTARASGPCSIWRIMATDNSPTPAINLKTKKMTNLKKR